MITFTFVRPDNLALNTFVIHFEFILHINCMMRFVCSDNCTKCNLLLERWLFVAQVTLIRLPGLTIIGRDKRIAAKLARMFRLSESTISIVE